MSSPLVRQMPVHNSDMNRLKELDGLRAIAILGVIAVHYAARFPGYYSYANDTISVFEYGYLGVHLFFIISGFVIALTLENSSSATEFAVRRFSRLAPPMVICSLITFGFLVLVKNDFTDLRRANLVDFVPSWSFTAPGIWEWLDPKVKYVDGVYWSLFYEVRFYFWSALIFFALGRERFAAKFVAFSAVTWAACQLVGTVSSTAHIVFSAIFIPDYIALFCAGVLFHHLYELPKSVWPIPALVICLLVAITAEPLLPVAATLGAFFAAFFLLVYRREWLSPLRSKSLGWIGLVSYSLYLLHQNIGVGLINEIGAVGGYAVPVVVAVAMVALASMVYLLVERHSSSFSRLILLALRRTVGT